MRRYRQETIMLHFFFTLLYKLASSIIINKHKRFWCTREIKFRIAFVKAVFNKQKILPENWT
jgi:hypothetical protein